MRLIVCSTRDQQRNQKRANPDDKVIVLGDPTYGLRVSEIIDRTFKKGARGKAEKEREEKWWALVQCRVGPS